MNGERHLQIGVPTKAAPRPREQERRWATVYREPNFAPSTPKPEWVVDVRSNWCVHQGCTKHPSYGVDDDSKNIICCSQHAKAGMVNTVCMYDMILPGATSKTGDTCRFVFIEQIGPLSGETVGTRWDPAARNDLARPASFDRSSISCQDRGRRGYGKAGGRGMLSAAAWGDAATPTHPSHRGAIRRARDVQDGNHVLGPTSRQEAWKLRPGVRVLRAWWRSRSTRAALSRKSGRLSHWIRGKVAWSSSSGTVIDAWALQRFFGLSPHLRLLFLEVAERVLQELGTSCGLCPRWTSGLLRHSLKPTISMRLVTSSFAMSAARIYLRPLVSSIHDYPRCRCCQLWFCWIFLRPLPGLLTLLLPPVTLFWTMRRTLYGNPKQGKRGDRTASREGGRGAGWGGFCFVSFPPVQRRDGFAAARRGGAAKCTYEDIWSRSGWEFGGVARCGVLLGHADVGFLLCTLLVGSMEVGVKSLENLLLHEKSTMGLRSRFLVHRSFCFLFLVSCCLFSDWLLFMGFEAAYWIYLGTSAAWKRRLSRTARVFFILCLVFSIAVR